MDAEYIDIVFDNKDEGFCEICGAWSEGDAICSSCEDELNSEIGGDTE